MNTMDDDEDDKDDAETEISRAHDIRKVKRPTLPLAQTHVLSNNQPLDIADERINAQNIPETSIAHLSPYTKFPTLSRHNRDVTHAITEKELNLKIRNEFVQTLQREDKLEKCDRVSLGMFPVVKKWLKESPDMSAAVGQEKNENYSSASEDEELMRPLCPPRLARRSSVADVYIAACIQAQRDPMNAFSRQIGNRDVNLGNRLLGADDVRPIAIALAKCENVERLTMKGNPLGALGVSYLADVVTAGRNLHHLDVSGVVPGVGGIISLTFAMMTNCRLTSLDLAENNLSLRHARIISNFIIHNQVLQELSLHHNCLDEDGGVVIGHALAKNTSLTCIDLSWNHLRRAGAQAVCNALLIGKNAITTDSATLTLDAIRSSPTCAINCLDLADTPVDGKFLESLYALQETRRFCVIRGQLYRREDVKEGHNFSTKGLDRFDPIMILFEYMKQDNFRLVDLFHNFDTDDSGYIDKAKLRAGFTTANIPMSESSLEDLVNSLDSNNDKKIELPDLMAGQRHVSRFYAERNGAARMRGKKEDDGLKDLRDIVTEFLRERTEKLKEPKDDASNKGRYRHAVSRERRATGRQASGRESATTPRPRRMSHAVILSRQKFN